MDIELEKEQQILIRIVRAIEKDIIFQLQKVFGSDIPFPQRKSDDPKLPMEFDRLKGKFKNVYYSDLGNIISFNKESLNLDNDQVNLIKRVINKSKDERNNVFHARDSEIKKIKEMKKFAYQLQIDIDSFEWNYLSILLSRKFNFDELDEKENILLTDIDRASNILHNLPEGDFAETGFIGRLAEMQKIIHTVEKTPYPINIVGEGGLGKTALLLNTLHKNLDRLLEKFEAIIWVSGKQQAMDSMGIRSLAGNPDTFEKVLDEIKFKLVQFGFSSQDTDIYTSLENKNILLAIDNIESLEIPSIKQFLNNIPSQTKVIMTSRVALGELERRINLSKMDSEDQLLYFNTLCHVYDVDQRFTEQEINLICQNLFGNPLLIKIMVQSMQFGAEFDISRKFGNAEHALKYCFENIYQSLDDCEKFLIKSLYLAQRPLDRREIIYLSVLENRSVEEVIEATGRLSSTSFISTLNTVDAGSVYISYSLNESARAYLSLSPDQSNNSKLYKSINTLLNLDHFKFNRNKYAWSTLRPSSRSQYLAAHMLDEAFQRNKDKDFVGRDAAIKASYDIDLLYPDILRMQAYFAASEPYYDWPAAVNFMRQTVDLDPTDASNLNFLSVALLNTNSEMDALQIINNALVIEPDAPELYQTKGNILARAKQYEEALLHYDLAISKSDSSDSRFINITKNQKAMSIIRKVTQFSYEKKYNEVLEGLHDAMGLIKEALESEDPPNTKRVLNRIGQQIRHMNESRDAVAYGKENISRVLTKFREVLEIHETVSKK